jgi:hypothetical protein
MKPTRKDMFNAMSWLVKDAKKHDSLFFHCNFSFSPLSHSFIVQSSMIISVDSGHGGQVTDKTGTEADGKDEGVYGNFLCIVINFPLTISSSLPSVIFPVDFKSTSYIPDNVRFYLLPTITIPIP